MFDVICTVRDDLIVIGNWTTSISNLQMYDVHSLTSDFLGK